MQNGTTRQFNDLQMPARLTWGLAAISEYTGLSMGFLRNEVRAGHLPVRRFGRRVLVRDQDLRDYLDRGSKPTESTGPESAG